MRRVRDASFWVGLLAVYLPAIWMNGVDFGGSELGGNPQVDEARAWWRGRLDLPERQWDTAYKDGKVYSHFPPMFSFVAAAVVPFFGGVPRFVIVILAAQVPWLAYVLFRRLTGSTFWGAGLAIGLVLGTSAWPVLERAMDRGAPYFVNQMLSLIGVLIFLNAYFGRRRVWTLGLGVIVTALSRQLTVALLLPSAYAAFSGGAGRERWRRLAGVALVTAVVGGVPMVMNTLKFGHPFSSGYLLVYAADDVHPARTDPIAMDARTYGVFSPAYLRRNLYYTNVGLPEYRRVRVDGGVARRLRSNYMGTGIWWTTPLLLWVFLDVGRIARDHDRRVLAVAAAAMYGALMFYHSTGWAQRGFNRYSLDYVPLLMCLVVPSCVTGRRRWLTAAMIAWGVVYFAWLIGPHAG